MKVLVTGANGFLGSWLTERLVADGHQVRVLRRESSDLSEIEHLDVEYCLGDVTDLEGLKKHFQSVEVVFHLAGVIGYKPGMRDLMERVNVEGTRNVVEACAKNNISKLVHMSSVAAIGAGLNRGEILNEGSLFNLSPYNLGYFETKKAAEDLVMEANQQQKVQAIILNPATIYGPNDARKGSRKAQVKVAQGKLRFCPPGGVNVVNVVDVVDATIASLEKANYGERYILAGENITLKQLFEHIAHFAGVSPSFTVLPKTVLRVVGLLSSVFEKTGRRSLLSRESATIACLYHWFDSSKAQRELNLKVTPARDSIEQSVRWMKENHIIP